MLRPTGASLLRAAFLVVWLPLDVYGFRPLRAREGHDPRRAVVAKAVRLRCMHSSRQVDWPCEEGT